MRRVAAETPAGDFCPRPCPGSVDLEPTTVVMRSRAAGPSLPVGGGRLPVRVHYRVILRMIRAGTGAVWIALAGFWPLSEVDASEDPQDALAPAGMTTPEPAENESDTHVRVQIYLDERNFGPGKIDGRIGEFTRKAVRAHNAFRGITPVDDWGPILQSVEKAVPLPYRTYTIAEDDFRFVTPGLPATPREQAGRRYLGYRSVSEFVAERFHTDERFLARLNKGKIRNLHALEAGSEVTVPNVTPFRIEDVPREFRFGEDPELSRHSVIVDTGERQATFLNAAGAVIASFPITPGQRRFIHHGEWKLLNMITTPTFRWDKRMLSQGRRGSDYHELPAGPNNPVGILWAGISRQGIGLHGTDSPHTIGRAQSAGCIRFSNWDAIRISSLIRPGGRVTIK